MKKVNWAITDHNIVVNFDGQTHHVSRSDSAAAKLISALKEKRYDDIPNLIMKQRRLEKDSDGVFTYQNGQVMVNGVPAPRVLGNKIYKFSEEGLPYEPLVLFAGKLQKNPSFRAVNELFEFLDKNDHPITSEGNFIAYKKVRPDFKDIYTGKFDNSVGTLVEMPRNQVNENPNETCSDGLHVANWNYAKNIYGGANDVMLEVEVDPADVVAVPVDYNQSKMRVCKYNVLSVVNEELSTSLRVTTASYSNHNTVNEENTEEDYRDECENCGEIVDFIGDTLCYSCERDEEDEEEEKVYHDDHNDINYNEEDEYPWDDEL